MYGLLYIGAFVVAIYYYIFHWRYKYWERKGIKYSEPKFPFGSLVLGEELHWGEIALRDYLKFKRYGPIYGGFSFINPIVYVNDKVLAKNILIKDFNSFYDRGVYHNPYDDPLHEHLFSLGGPKWQKLRQKLTPVFTTGKIKNMMPIVLKIGHNFVEAIKDEVKVYETIEMKEWVSRFFTDVIGNCAFGLECNSLKDPNAEFRVMGKHTHADMNPLTTFLCFYMPSLALKLRISLTPKPIEKFFIKVVEDTIQYREQNNIERNDFMDLLIKMRNKNKSNDLKDSDMDGLSIHEIAAQSFVFFLAGFETSSLVVSYTLLELALNQEIQDQVRNEINDVFSKYGNEITYDSLQDMNYLEQCINESMRKYPVLGVIYRKATRDYPVPNTKYIIPKGTLTVIPTYAFNHDPEAWPEPEKFDPDRFNNMNSSFAQSKGFYPFGDGPKDCIGERFGKIQTKVAMVMLLKNFKFTTSGKTIFPVRFNTDMDLLTMKDGVYLNVEFV